MQTWKTAAEAYRKDAKRQQQPTPPPPDRHAQEEQERQDMTELTQAMDDFQRFITTDGQAALELLTASNRHIVLGEENEGGGQATVYFLDGKGLQMSVEATGTRLVYMKEIPPPKIRTVSVAEAVTAATTLGRIPPKELVGWLRGKLDNIANAAPVTT